MRIHRIIAVALLVAISFVALVTPTSVDDWWADPPAPVPTLTDISATWTPTLFSVTGTDFTPGGRVYLAIYDQMGTQLYETRWITASLATTGLHHEPGDGLSGRSLVAIPGGALRESFGQLCGATAMMRGLDEITATWSNWLVVQPACLRDTTV